MKENNIGMTVGNSDPRDSLISIIIPVYNVAPYLREALDSVIHQTYENLKIIIIDDGSTDESGSISDAYKSDPRITVIHRKNGGLSSARNTGLDNVAGQYIAFLDSDDVLHPSFIEKLHFAITRYDAGIVECQVKQFRTCNEINDKIAYRKITQRSYGRNEALRALVDGRISPSVCNKLYRIELWDKIRFADGQNFEDNCAIFQVFDICEKISVTDEILYFYRMRKDSITHSYSEKNMEDYDAAMSYVEDFIERHMPEVFTANQLEERRRSHLKGLIGNGINVKDKALSEKVKKRVIELAKETKIDYRSRTKVLYQMYCRCPKVLRIVRPIYSQCRRFLLWIFE